MSFRDLYGTLEFPGANRLRDAQAALGRVVGGRTDMAFPAEMRALQPLPLLLALNQKCAADRGEKQTVVGPGLPAFCDRDGRFLSADCLRMPGG